ncbi:hypothetical protein FACS1894130_06110 [Spirochaetia bacterium]|nr:hypothetical protein FACS1894130_06110 [Spirochaetia bacterium]
MNIRTVCVLFFSVVLHGVLLFCIVFRTGIQEMKPEKAVAINLVSIEEYQEAPPPPKKAVKPEIPEVPPVVEDPITEEVIEVEELPPEELANEAESGVDEPGGVEGGIAGSTAKGGGEAEIAAYVSEYIRGNYTYIQKRIMQELIYPSRARRTGIQGVVEIAFVINRDGSISEVAVRKTSGKSILDDEALRAVRSAAPFHRPNVPVRITIPVSFKLT